MEGLGNGANLGGRRQKRQCAAGREPRAQKAEGLAGRQGTLGREAGGTGGTGDTGHGAGNEVQWVGGRA